MSYSETIDYLYALQKFGFKFGLDNITKLLQDLDNPHRNFRTIHISGTNGKGSTAHMIASILQSAGLDVGLFTSPHLLSFTERIRVNSTPISESEVIDLAAQVKSVAESSDDFSPTFFEVVTALAMIYFKRHQVDIAVIEVGMGGRLDATNIVTPEVSVITSVSYDHSQFLGKTVREIAREKAGIIKITVPVVSAAQEDSVDRVIEETAKQNSSLLYTYGRDFNGFLKTSSRSGIVFDYHDDKLYVKDIHISVLGKHQVMNACMAIKASMLGTECFGSNLLAPYSIRKGFRDLSLSGRLEYRDGDPAFIFDGAHNPSAAGVLADILNELFLDLYQRRIVILGVMDDKDIEGIMKPLLPFATDIILTQPSYARAARPEKLSHIAEYLGYFNTYRAPRLQEALRAAFLLHEGNNGSPDVPAHANTSSSPSRHHLSSIIVVTGSFYTVGEAQEILGEKSVLSRLRETP